MLKLFCDHCKKPISDEYYISFTPEVCDCCENNIAEATPEDEETIDLHIECWNNIKNNFKKEADR